MDPAIDLDALVTANPKTTNFYQFGSRFSGVLHKGYELCFFYVFHSFLSIFFFLFQFISSFILVPLPYLGNFLQSCFGCNIILLFQIIKQYVLVIGKKSKYGLVYLPFFLAINIDARKWLFPSLFHGL